MSPSNSPCAACKILRRKCTQDCVFAPYFPRDNPQMFTCVHKVFGASNVAKILSDLNPAQREDAVKSLAYEAEARLRDPVYGSVGIISVLQHRLKRLQAELLDAKKELANYVGPHPSLPVLQTPGAAYASSLLPPNIMPAITGIPTNGGQLAIRDPQQHQILEAQVQQLATATAAREQQTLMRLNDASGSGSGSAPFHINQTHQPEHHHSFHHQFQAQLMLTTQQPKPQSHQSPLSPSQPKSESEEARIIGPSC